MPLQRLMATMSHLPKPPSAVKDRPIAGLLRIKSETSAWILGMGNMLRRAGGNMETSNYFLWAWDKADCVGQISGYNNPGC